MIVEFLPRSEDELEEAYCFYEARGTSLGTEFKQDAMKAAELISAHPHAGAIVHENARRILFGRFPYALIYRIDDDRIVVLAVAHLRRQPF
mgnify:CR=1 FL=1